MKESVRSIIKRLFGRGVRRSYGQFGEDTIVQVALRGVIGGTYIDVGAYHPILYSNTYALYCRGWHGFVVDPNHTMSPLYRLLRHRDVFINTAIGCDCRELYHSFSDGAYNTLDTDEAEKRKKMPYLKYLGSREIECKSLADVVKENGIRHIDFLNVDVEGQDLAVLKSHDWSVPPSVIAVEDEIFDPKNPEHSELFRFLSEKGYTMFGFSGLTCVWKKV